MTDDATKKELDPLALAFRHPWLVMRDHLWDVWLAAVSTDAAERIARKAGVGEDDARRLAPVIRELVAALATSLDRMPVRETRPAFIPGANIDAHVARRNDVGRARGAFMTDERPPSTYEAHQQWRQRPQSGVSVRGWLDHELVEGDANGDMLRADRALLDVAGAYLVPSDREKVEKGARARWKKFRAAVEVTWRSGSYEGYTAVDDADAKRLARLWRCWVDGTNAKTVTIAAQTKLRRDEEARREAARAEILRAGRPPAVIRHVPANIMSTTVQQIEIPLEGDRVPVATIDGHRWATIAPEHHGALSLLGTRPGQRLVRTLTLTAHKQWLDEHPDPRVVTIDGGIAGLTEHFGKLRVESGFMGLLEAGQSLKIELANETWAGLWTYRATRGGGRSTGVVEVTVGTVLMPLAVHQLSKRTPPPDRRLVPVLEHDVPVGRFDTSKHGAVYRAHFGVLVALVDRSPEIDQRGGVRLTDADWANIVRRAGLPSDARAQLVETWLAGDDETCPLLARDGDVWRLADEHAEAWKFIAQGGARRRQSQAAGRKAAESRRPKG